MSRVAPHDTPSASDTRRLKQQWAEKEAKRYRAAIERLERNGPQLKWVWLIGLPLSILMGGLGLKYGVICFGTMLCFAFTGRYFFFIQKKEAEEGLLAAERDLRKYQV